MSVADRATPVPAPIGAQAPRDRGRELRLSGWGRAAFSRARVITATSAEEVAGVLADRTLIAGGVIARGAGRSYGDAAQNAAGTVLDVRELNEVVELDPARRRVRVQAGVTYAQLLSELVPRGFMLPVIPGTRHVTIGGAIASDVHGKNHHRDGSLARHVHALTMCTPADGCRELTAESDSELMLATLGGMGLLGVVVEATLAIEPLRTASWTVDIDRTDSLDDTLDLMALDERHRFSVAWLDLLASGARMGQAVVTRSNAWPSDEPHAGSNSSSPLAPARLHIPRGLPGALLAPPLIAAFNELRWRSFPRRARGRAMPLAGHFFPLDGIGEWNRLYGSRGLIQYQFVVPDGQEAALVRCVDILRARRIPTYLAVLKRLGAGTGAPLSFPIAGWTLALDIPAWAAGLRPTLDTLDEIVAGAGGRVYLTKDLRLRRDVLAAMYPRLGELLTLKAQLDPDDILRSDLGRRLGLCRTAA